MSSNTITVAYVDLSTYDEIEELLYAGASAANIFHARITKCIWFAQMPIKLRNSSGTPDFGNTFSFSQPRQGDYATYTWVRITLPALTISAAGIAAGYRIAWADDIGNAIFSEIVFSVNDIPLQKYGTFYMEHRANHSVDESHWQTYQNMIGNKDSLIVPATTINQQVIDVPLWAFYQKHGAAFPHSNIPYADIKWEFTLRSFRNLVKVEGAALDTVLDTLTNTGTNNPSLVQFQTWTNYAVLTQDMRSLMGAIPRQMLIDQVQETSANMNLPGPTASTGVDTSVDLRFSYHMVWLAWVAQNLTRTTAIVGIGYAGAGQAGYQYTNYTDNVDPGLGNVPIGTTTILYESSERLNAMPADYYGWIVPFFHFERSPKKTGFQTWCLAYFGNSYNPTGGLNASRMFNMSAKVNSISTLEQNLPLNVTSAAVSFKLLFLAQVKQIILFTGGGIVIEFH